MRSDDSPFTVALRELMAAFVSGTNACQYCTGAHSATAMEGKMLKGGYDGIFNVFDLK